MSLRSEIYDVVVWGATPGGIMAADSAALSGARVALVEQTGYVGGIWAQGGLTNIDQWYPHSWGGRSWQYIQELMRRHGLDRTPSFVTPVANAPYPREGVWVHPGKSEILFMEWIRRSGVDLVLNAPLDYVAGQPEGAVIKSGLRVTGIRTTQGVILGRAFIDATYEMDLAKGAGCRYRVGRESAAEYGEGELAGHHPAHQYNATTTPPLPASVALFNPDGTPRYPLQPTPDPPLVVGAADSRVMSSTFRCTLAKQSIGNHRPFWKPPGYREEIFGFFRDQIIARNLNSFSQVFTHYTLVLNKWNLNNNSNAIPVSTDLTNRSWGYADGTPEQRRRLFEEHKLWVTGCLWEAANHPAMPAALRASAQDWGYAADEFVGNDNFPREMYIREGRRLWGDFVLTHLDVTTNKFKTDGICWSVYPTDCHGPHVYISAPGEVTVDGDMYLPNVGRYEIPLRVILPRAVDCTNVVVPVCSSVSHVAWAPYRMEPQFMMVGEAAGVVAAHAAATGLSVQSVPYSTVVRPTLLARGATLRTV